MLLLATNEIIRWEIIVELEKRIAMSKYKKRKRQVRGEGSVNKETRKKSEQIVTWIRITFERMSECSELTY